jgi:hypothetical protein
MQAETYLKYQLDRYYILMHQFCVIVRQIKPDFPADILNHHRKIS